MGEKPKKPPGWRFSGLEEEKPTGIYLSGERGLKDHKMDEAHRVT